MQIISHYDDENNIVGFSFTGDLEQEIEITENLLHEDDYIRVRDNNVIFETREGEVEYLLTEHDPRFHFYKAILVEDRRG